MLRFAFVAPESLAAELSSAVQILDEGGAEMWDYAVVHGIAASMAAVFGNVPLAQQEAAVALEMSRRVGNPTALGVGLYSFALASWQSDPTAAQVVLDEEILIIRSRAYDFMLPRSLALLAQLLARGGDIPAAFEALREGLESAHTNGDLSGTAVCLARGAMVMAALGEPETAAVFLGAATNSVLARPSGVSPNEIPDYDEFVSNLLSHLGEDRYTAATAHGAAMTYEQATAFALAAIEDLAQN
jgi:hypothetical protein